MKAWRPLAAGSAVVALTLLGWAVLVEPRRVSVRTVDLALPSWPPELDGLRHNVFGRFDPSIVREAAEMHGVSWELAPFRNGDSAAGSRVGGSRRHA